MKKENLNKHFTAPKRISPFYYDIRIPRKLKKKVKVWCGTSWEGNSNASRLWYYMEKNNLNYKNFLIKQICLIEKWNLTSDVKPKIGDHVEFSNDGVEAEGTLMYLENRTCMMAGIAGGNGYFGEGFATDGENCDYGLICDDPKYWRLIESI